MSIQNAIDRILISAPGATRAAVEMLMLQVAIDFCERSGVWNHRETINTVAGTTTYALTPPVGGEVCKLDWVWLDGALVVPISEQARPGAYPERSYAYDFDTDSVELNASSVKTKTGGLVVDYWLKPDMLASLPALVTDGHETALVAGVLSDLFLQPNRPYTNPAMAQVYARKYKNERSRARRLALSSRSRTDVGWTFAHQGHGKRIYR